MQNLFKITNLTDEKNVYIKQKLQEFGSVDIHHDSKIKMM